MKKLTINSTVYGPFTEVLTKDNHYLCDGSVLPFTVLGIETLSDSFITEWEGALPVAPEVKAEIIQRIKAERDRRKFNGVYVADKWIHTDTYSRTQWLGMAMMGANLPVIEWTTMDGTTINTTPALAQAVFSAIAQMDSVLFTFAKSLAVLVQESDNPSSINITTGWPATFGEQ